MLDEPNDNSTPPEAVAPPTGDGLPVIAGGNPTPPKAVAPPTEQVILREADYVQVQNWLAGTSRQIESRYRLTRNLIFLVAGLVGFGLWRYTETQTRELREQAILAKQESAASKEKFDKLVADSQSASTVAGEADKLSKEVKIELAKTIKTANESFQTLVAAANKEATAATAAAGDAKAAAAQAQGATSAGIYAGMIEALSMPTGKEGDKNNEIAIWRSRVVEKLKSKAAEAPAATPPPKS